jgi:hypothetical protein
MLRLAFPGRPSSRRPRRRFLPTVEVLRKRIVPSTFTVTRTADDDGEGSLRWAITQANGNAGPDTIAFQIPGPGVQTIQPLSALPTITDPVLLDGTSQPGFGGSPLIELDGSQAGSNVSGLSITASDTTVDGLVINRFSSDGIDVVGGSNDVIQENYIGTDVTGAVALGNGRYGVGIYGGAASNRVGTDGDGVADAAERNLIAGNQSWGVIVADPGSNQNMVAGNYIGTDVTGTAALANAGGGVAIWGGAQSNRVGVNDQDAAPADDRNLISGNSGTGSPGVLITDGGTDQNIVAGNYVGTDVSGTRALGNGGVGVFIEGGAQSNRVGTNGDGVDDAAEANLICANAYQGIAILGPGTDQNVVAGNHIGVDATGNAVLGNGNNGVWVLQGAQSNRIGTNGTDPDAAGEGNLIGGNAGSGVLISDAGTDGNTVAGNAIGTDPAGASHLGNGGSGVTISNGARNNPVGGSAALGNVIAFNQQFGVTVTDARTTGNTIRANSIFGNTELGIDLAADGVTLNHAGDANTGPNNLQNYPVILTADPGTATTVSGTLSGTAGTTYTLDFYASAQPSWLFFGDGQRYLGSQTVTTDANGNAGFSATLSAATGAGEWLTATATDPGGNTSEFSEARQLSAATTIGADSWTPIGPAPVTGRYNQAENGLAAGRVNVAAPDPTNANVMYLGGDDGGVWKTSNWLSPNPTWTPLTDQQPSLSIGEHDLVVFPGNPQVVYAAANRPGGGILKSTDGGTTWTFLANSLFQSAVFGALVVDPANANTLYAAENDGGPAGGVYRSTDGGQTWQNLTASTVVGAASDLALDPTNPLVLYAGFWATADGGAGNGVYKSSDGGATWARLGNGVPAGPSAGFIRLALAPSAPQTVYATVFNSANTAPSRYRTIDGGATWSSLTGLPGAEEGRTWHVMLAVDPTDANTVWANGDHSVYRSTDRGATWAGPLFGEDPVGGYFDAAGGFVLVGDRGIHRTPDHGTTWDPPKEGNLQVTEFYDVTLDPTNPAIAYGISQDHTAALKFTGGPVWTYLGGGDETGKVLVDPVNPSRLYNYDPLNATSFIQRSDDAGASWSNAGTGIDTSQNGFGLAYAAQKAFVMDPGNRSRLLVGTDRVYETTSGANSWTAISGVLSGGQFVSALAVAPSQGNTVYAGTSDGRFFATTSDGTTWAEIDQGLPGGSVSAIQVDPADPRHVLATMSGGVWMTADGGNTWSKISGNLPVNSYYSTNSIAVDWRFTTPVLYVGTERGVYRSLDLGTDWAPFDQGLPNTSVTDLEFVPGLDLLAAATYGRGVFEVQLPGPATHFGISTPTGVTAGTPFGITVTALDAAGNPAPTYTGTAHFTSSDNGPGRLLPDDYTFAAGDNGVHTFSNGVTLVTAGSQTVTATDAASATLTGSADAPVSPAAADHLAVTQQPAGTTAGLPINAGTTPSGLRVGFFDAFNNLLTGDDSDTVTVAIHSGPSSGLAGTLTQTASGGVAVFGNLSIATVGTYTLQAVSGTQASLAAVNSVSFAVNPAIPDHLALSVQPTDSVAGSALNPAIEVEVRDANDQLLTVDNSDRVTVRVASGPGDFTAGSTTTVTVSGGVATFSNLVLTVPGRYTLNVSGPAGLPAFSLAMHLAQTGPPPGGLLTVASLLTHSAEYYARVVTAAYQHYLGRTPAPSEVAGWVGALQRGLSDGRLEAGFIGSPEYIANHGGQGTGWVTGMYVDLLGRTPAPSEVAGWVNALQGGLAPAAVAYGFAASPEREGQRITADYQDYLNRTPEPGIVAAWVQAFENGFSNENVIAGFVGSVEYFQKHHDNVPDWIFSAYNDVLARDPEPAALQGWTQFLQNG